MWDTWCPRWRGSTDVSQVNHGGRPFRSLSVRVMGHSDRLTLLSHHLKESLMHRHVPSLKENLGIFLIYGMDPDRDKSTSFFPSTSSLPVCDRVSLIENSPQRGVVAGREQWEREWEWRRGEFFVWTRVSVVVFYKRKGEFDFNDILKYLQQQGFRARIILKRGLGEHYGSSES